MSKKKRLLPFKFMPASWGLYGRVRKEAEAAYYYDGLDLEYELAAIRFEDDPGALAREKLIISKRHHILTAAQYDFEILKLEGKANDPIAILAFKRSHDQITDYEYDRQRAIIENTTSPAQDIALLTVDLNHKKITVYEHDKAVVMLLHPEEGKDQQLGLLEVEFAHGKMTELQHEKERATLLEEPWIRVVDDGFDPDRGVNGVYLEFDWNEYWIAFLRLNGYSGFTDEQIIDEWFRDVCRSTVGPVLMPDQDGVVPFGSFVARANRE